MKTRFLPVATALWAVLMFPLPGNAADNEAAIIKYQPTNGFQVQKATKDIGSGVQADKVVIVNGSGTEVSPVAGSSVTSPPGATPSPSPYNVLNVQGAANGIAMPVAASQRQYTGAPSNATVGTTDATVFTLAVGEIGFIQNLDDAALNVKYGAGASTSSLSFVLMAGAAADDGKGGSYWITNWTGAVSVAAAAGSPRYIAFKIGSLSVTQ